MAKIIRIGFLGLGVVGARLLTILQENRQMLLKEYDVEIIPEAILVRDTKKARAADITGLRLTTDENELIDNEQISILVECMGGAGAERTRDILLRALEKGKYVILSSKKCLAANLAELTEAAKRNGCQLRYDATVGGGIPICSTLRSMAKGEEITGIYGILNSTTNYILSSVSDKGIPYAQAVEDAKRKGYTENDPSEDVDGWDAAYKLVILMNLGMKLSCTMEKIKPEPMKEVKPERNDLQERDNAVLKQIACARKNQDSSVSYYVGPCLVEADQLLARVSGNNNMIFVESRESGIRAFYGQGSGAGPTASIMFDDLLDVLLNPIEPEKSVTCNTVHKLETAERFIV